VCSFSLVFATRIMRISYFMSSFCGMFHSPLLFPTFRSFQLHHVFNLDNENRAEDTPTLIDRKVRSLQ
jgi:hypothetical protein